MQKLKLSALAFSLTLLLAGGVQAQQNIGPQPFTPPPGPLAAFPAPSPLFSDKERGAIVAFWQTAGRYTIAAPPAAMTDGPFQVRLTAEGSAWFLAYQKAVGAGGKFIPPTRDARPTSGPYAEWDAWIALKLAYDRATALQAADNANKLILNRPLLAPGLSAASPATAASPAQVLLGGTSVGLPPAPGAIPTGLLATVGNPPPLAGVVVPLLYTVSFEKPDEVFSYTDNVKLRERYAYYRFPRGVVSYGKQLKDMTSEERDGVFRAAGFSEGDQRIFSAVSKLEGGFETVQTYDTGYVSIGFIQFVTLGDGKADLSNVLREMKMSDPKAFKEDFRRFGIDVAPDLSITVIDPATGAELVGNPAVLKIIDDKRLTAVFQRAGRKSPFRIAQIKIARSYYWPQFDPLTVTLPDGTTFIGTVGDVVKSEAGLATLLDRKINIGNIRSLPAVIAQCMATHGCKTLADAALYEKDIVATMKYRTDFLADATLAQPIEPPTPPALPTPGVSVAVKSVPGAATPNTGGATSVLEAPTIFVAPRPFLPIGPLLPDAPATVTPAPVKSRTVKDAKETKLKANKKKPDDAKPMPTPAAPTPTESSPPASPSPTNDPAPGTPPPTNP